MLAKGGKLLVTPVRDGCLKLGRICFLFDTYGTGSRRFGGVNGGVPKA